MDKTNATLDQIDALLSLRNPSPPIPGLARELLEKAAATIRAQAAELERGKAGQVAPGGWKLVPVELTREMYNAFGYVKEVPLVLWNRVLSAAPAAPAQVGWVDPSCARSTCSAQTKIEYPAHTYTFTVPLYTATPAAEQPERVKVPRESMERWERKLSGDNGYGWEEIMLEELRALLAGGEA